MTDWKKVSGSQAVKPAEFDTTSSPSTVYQRKNIERVTFENDFGGTSDFWQYDERTMSHDEYSKLRAELLENEVTNLQLALVELYERTI